MNRQHTDEELDRILSEEGCGRIMKGRFQAGIPDRLKIDLQVGSVFGEGKGKLRIVRVPCSEWREAELTCEWVECGCAVQFERRRFFGDGRYLPAGCLDCKEKKKKKEVVGRAFGPQVVKSRAEGGLYRCECSICGAESYRTLTLLYAANKSARCKKCVDIERRSDKAGKSISSKSKDKISDNDVAAMLKRFRR